MKKLNFIFGVFILTFCISKIQYAEDSSFVYFPKEVKEFNENLLKFLREGNVSYIESYIKPSTELIKGKTLFKCSSDAEKEIFQKEFTEGQNTEGLNYQAWSSDGKYYYLILKTSPDKELSVNYNSIFIEITEDKNVILKVWHKS